MSDAADLLVSTRIADACVGVRRSGDKSLWLTSWTGDMASEEGRVRLHAYDPAQIAGDDWAGIGGAVPAITATVEVYLRDQRWHPTTVDLGAWVWAGREELVCEPGSGTSHVFGFPPVAFRDADGRLVSSVTDNDRDGSRRMWRPERWLSGLDRSCPVCAKQSWMAAKEVDSDHFGRIFCGRCGYLAQVG